MAVTIKNKKLHKAVFKRIKAAEDRSFKLIEKGKLSKARKFEELSDKIYKDNYHKMFKVTREK